VHVLRTCIKTARLLGRGVRIYEQRYAMLHAKPMVVDTALSKRPLLDRFKGIHQRPVLVL
jgi:hypothetical protein